MKNYKNKMKKFSLTIIAGTILASTPIQSYAVFGIGDFNIQDIPKLLASFYQLAMEKMSKAIDSIEKALHLNVQVDTAKKAQEMANSVNQAISLRQQFSPNPQACNYMRNNTALLQAGSAASAGAAQASSQSVKDQQNKKEKAAQVNEIRNVIQQRNCTEDDVKKGVYGCTTIAKDVQIADSLTGSTAGLNRNPAVIYGWVDPKATVNSTVNNGNGGNARNTGGAKNTGDTIPKSAFQDAENFIELKYYSREPSEISNKNANGEADGANYTMLRDTFLNRKNSVKFVEMKYLQKYKELDSNSGLTDFWGSAKGRTKELYGDNYVAPTMPSEQEVLKYAVNSSFAKIATAFNNLGDNEKQMAIVQMKLQYEMLDAQRDTNRILGAIFMQLADPINPSQLDNARTAAEVRSR